MQDPDPHPDVDWKLQLFGPVRIQTRVQGIRQCNISEDERFEKQGNDVGPSGPLNGFNHIHAGYIRDDIYSIYLQIFHLSLQQQFLARVTHREGGREGGGENPRTRLA